MNNELELLQELRQYELLMLNKRLRDLQKETMWTSRAKPLWHLKALRDSSKSPWLFSLVCSYSDTPPKKSKLAPLQERRMIDRFKLCAKGGDGGNGCHSSRRSRHDRRGRPDGGNGGRGGDVILECSHALWDFSSLQHHVTASRGGHGASKNKIGTRGADKVVQVPIGTVIHLIKGEIPCMVEKIDSPTDLDPWEIPGTLVNNLSGSGQQPPPDDRNSAGKVVSSFNTASLSSRSRAERTTDKSFHYKKTTSAQLANEASQISSSSEMFENSTEEDTEDNEEEMQYNVAELMEEGQCIIVSHGGEGGLGNVATANVPKKPKTMKGEVQVNDPIDPEECDDESSLSTGLPGSEAVIVLELKSIADVGLVGMPNAGKSTLLGAMSRAKPTVGHYAFTTLRPNLGNLNYDDLSITIADIPGLIKGAHENRGLGHAFLRHIERTRVLAYVVDLAAALDGRKGIQPWQQLKDLVLELEHHQVGLSERPSLVVANKIDEEGAEQVYKELRARVHGVPVFPVCAVLEEGVSELKIGLKSLVSGQIAHKLSLDNILVD